MKRLSHIPSDSAGAAEPKVVEEVFERFAGVYNLRVGGEVIATTGEHPFFVAGKGWMPANELRAGDRLRCADGTTVAVEEVSDSGNWVLVYNLRIADYHTYFVGCDEWGFKVWSHNAYMPGANQQYAQQGQDYAKRAVEIWWGALPFPARESMTVAVTRKQGVEYVVLCAGVGNGRTQLKPEQLATLEEGFKAIGTNFTLSRDAHAERYMYDNYRTGLTAIGINNHNGPCETCLTYFTGKFENIWWPDR